MGIIELIVVLVVVGVVLWLINNHVPMDPKIKSILNVAVVIIVVLWLLSVFFPTLGDIRIDPSP